MKKTVLPFKATYYNPEIFKDISDLICPPYDVIDKEKIDFFKNKSSCNFCNILIANNGDYRSLGEKLDQWIKEKILVEDNQESFYLYAQHFKFEAKKYLRIGIIALLCIDKKGVILPHENTLTVLKEDRKKVIEEVKSNLCPIFTVTVKPVKIFLNFYNLLKNTPPFLEFKDYDGNTNFIWKIDETKYINKISEALQDTKLIIADGHHRFEVAYQYYLQNKEKFKNLNYILAYISTEQEGLLILPTHRIVTADIKKDDLLKKLENDFFIRKVSRKYLEKFLLEENIFCFGIYVEGEFYFLKLKNYKRILKVPKAKIYRGLDTYLFNHLVLPLFKFEDISYTHDISELERLTCENKIGFILRPISLKNIFRIAKQGYKLPQKSTYFYPKIPSGILLRRFEVK